MKCLKGKFQCKLQIFFPFDNAAVLAGGSRAAALQQQQLLQQQMPPALFDMFYEELLTDLMKTGDLVRYFLLTSIFIRAALGLWAL
jgi:hypothetical protein